ncbi:MAG: VWA domain-containing protein [Pseudomonadota bacterium]
MDQTLAHFIQALRNSNVRVSPAETLDAFTTVDLVGYRDREHLKRSLALVLPKTEDEKDTFDACFDEFFKIDDVSTNTDTTEGLEDGEGEEDGGDEQGDGDGQQSGGQREPGQPGKSKSKRKGKPKSRSGLDDELEEEEEDLGPGPMSEASSDLGKLLMANSMVELTVKMAEGAREVNLEEIQVFTQKGLYTRRIMEAMGLDDLNREIGGLRRSKAVPDRRLGQALQGRRELLREQVRDYVEKQFLLFADSTGRKLREELLRQVKLSNVEQRNFRMIQEIVFRMAKKLCTMYSRRKKVFKKGQLNIPRTLRHNMSYDGAIFDLHWKSVKIDRPRVFAICDVSGSVATYARFMLTFLYSLEEVMPKVRSFAFSSDLAEVTDLFQRNNIEDAIAKTLRDYAGGSTDYGQSLEDFKRMCLPDIDNRTTIIILGDARNNYGEHKAEIMKELYDRAKTVMWLNPEARQSWDSGDSEMRRYGAYCHQVHECSTLVHLERIVGNLLRNAYG